MKKILIIFTIVISCLGISRVSADTLYFEDTSDVNFIQYNELIGNDNFNTILNEVLDVYKNSYMSSYPYFYINVDFYSLSSDPKDHFNFHVELNCGKNKPEIIWTWAVSKAMILTRFKLSDLSISRDYEIIVNSNNVFDLSVYNETIIAEDTTDGYNIGYGVNIFNIYSEDYTGPYDSAGAYYTPYVYYLSNFDLYLPSFPSEYRSYDYILDYDSFGIPLLDGSNLSTIVSFDREDYLIEPYYLYDTDVDVSVPNIEEINLNNYSYIALSLKDYNQEPFSTQVHVKGNYCLTPVYNYGMTERKDILTGSQVERCSPYYDNYTPVRTYILESDLKNHAIYYLKAYDTTRDNYIKVDTSVFDVTYVTEENKDNPYVTIGGKIYPTIPYDNLTDTSTKSEDEGYVSGAVKEFSFSDIFTAPLEFLKDIWDSIVSVFDLVKEFFSLLPEPIPTFLFVGFTLAIALGIIKIIL